MENWYYVSPKTEESVGPVSTGKLIDEATPETMVWKEESLPEWVAAKNHPDLIDFLDNLAENNHSNIIPSGEEKLDGAIQNESNSVDNNANLLIQMPTLEIDFGPSDLKYELYFDNIYYTTLNALGTKDELLVNFVTSNSNLVLKIIIKGIIRVPLWRNKLEFPFEETREITFRILILENVTKITLAATKLIPVVPWFKITKFKDVEFTILFRDDNFVEV
jgi:hypothetical protein